MLFSDPLTAEAARYLLTFKEASAVLEGFRETQSSLEAAVAELRTVHHACHGAVEAREKAILAIREAGAAALTDLAAAREGTRLDKVIAKMSADVHDNGYAALERLVTRELKTSRDHAAKADDKLARLIKDSESRMSKMCADMVAANEVMARNLEAAVLGKPALPVTPPGASVAQRLRTWVLTPLVLLRRWCIDAIPPAIGLGVIVGYGYLYLLLRHTIQ